MEDWPGCSSCKHLRPMQRNSDKGWTCKAFPDGIPMPIASGHIDHILPIEGDNGIQFEPIQQ